MYKITQRRIPNFLLICHGVDAGLARKLVIASQRYDLSVSKIVLMCVRVALPWVKEYLDGISIDMDAMGFSLTEEGKARRAELEAPRSLFSFIKSGKEN